jgi:hypothetical protein
MRWRRLQPTTTTGPEMLPEVLSLLFQAEQEGLQPIPILAALPQLQAPKRQPTSQPEHDTFARPVD